MRRNLRRIAPSIPTASMADIAFLLIIFFMLTTSFSPERTNVELPTSEIRTEVDKDSAIVAITPDGVIAFSSGEEPSQPVSLDELAELTDTIIAVVPDKQFVIKADRNVRYELIDAVLEQLRSHGVKNLGLLTQKKVRREG